MKEVTLTLKEDFITVEKGTHYQLPCYEVIEGKGIQRTETFISLHESINRPIQVIESDEDED